MWKNRRGEGGLYLQGWGVSTIQIPIDPIVGVLLLSALPFLGEWSILV